MQGGGHERSARAGLGQGAQVGEVSHAATGQQLELGEAGAELAHQRDVRTRAGPDARDVEHNHLPHAGVAQPRQRLARTEPGQLAVRRQDAAGAEVEAERQRGVPELGPQPLERGQVRERLGADHHAHRAQLEQHPGRGGVGDAGIHHHPRLARQGG